MDAEASRRVGLRVGLHLRHHPDAAVIVVGRLADMRGLLHWLAPYRPSLASVAFAADLPEAMLEGVTLYDAGALAEQGPGIAERETAILIEGENVRVLGA